jgi:MurNAc alpha-1-phosphate uridylyltransferase
MNAYSKTDKMPSLALLAGGLGSRLGSFTTQIPKSMVEVAGRPFIAHQLLLLVEQGIEDIVICCGHLGEQIEAFVGGGREFGVAVRYSHDGNMLLGTGGALKRALPLLGDRFLVMYGDSYLTAPILPVWQAFRLSGKAALMTVLHNEDRWDKSNIEYSDSTIQAYSKLERTASMRHVDYGLGVFKAEAFERWHIDEVFDLAFVYQSLLAENQLAAYEVTDRFYEIGSPAGLEETASLLRTRRRRSYLEILESHSVQA